MYQGSANQCTMPWKWIGSGDRDTLVTPRGDGGGDCFDDEYCARISGNDQSVANDPGNALLQETC